MKAVATINFKGGVGKSTITWLLAKYLAEKQNKKVLVIDIDAQMSLTMAVQLQEESGLFASEFDQWYENMHCAKRRTILNALEAYDQLKGGHFDFPIDSFFLYKMSENLFLLPSVVDLYWLELEVFDREKVKHFARALLGKIGNSRLYKFDYVFFDCPPNFAALSYSVLSCASLILIPVNPDVFASRGVEMMIDGLKFRIEPWPDARVAVFMNKAKLYKGGLTKETKRYLEDVKAVCDKKRKVGVNIEAWDSFIPDRMHIKRAIPGRYFPDEFEEYFQGLFENIKAILR